MRRLLRVFLGTMILVGAGFAKNLLLLQMRALGVIEGAQEGQVLLLGNRVGVIDLGADPFHNRRPGLGPARWIT